MCVCPCSMCLPSTEGGAVGDHVDPKGPPVTRELDRPRQGAANKNTHIIVTPPQRVAEHALPVLATHRLLKSHLHPPVFAQRGRQIGLCQTSVCARVCTCVCALLQPLSTCFFNSQSGLWTKRRGREMIKKKSRRQLPDQTGDENRSSSSNRVPPSSALRLLTTQHRRTTPTKYGGERGWGGLRLIFLGELRDNRAVAEDHRSARCQSGCLRGSVLVSAAKTGRRFPFVLLCAAVPFLFSGPVAPFCAKS